MKTNYFASMTEEEFNELKNAFMIHDDKRISSIIPAGSTGIVQINFRKKSDAVDFAEHCLRLYFGLKTGLSTPSIRSSNKTNSVRF